MWQTIRASSLGRHHHRDAYAALVLSGGYEEAGDHGRFQVAAGEVVLHGRFEAHLDRFSASGAVLLNLRLPLDQTLMPGIARIEDPDLIARTAEKDRPLAARLLLATATKLRPAPADWPDELAAALLNNPSLALSRWAEHRGLAVWTVSRGFAQVFGIPPETFRARVRAHRAWKSIQTSGESLSTIAAHLGFSDHSHMTRSVGQLTGMTPRMWRSAANGFKTDAARNR